MFQDFLNPNCQYIFPPHGLTFSPEDDSLLDIMSCEDNKFPLPLLMFDADKDLCQHLNLDIPQTCDMTKSVECSYVSSKQVASNQTTPELSPDQQNSKEHCFDEGRKKRSHTEKTKNILINMGTFLKNFMKQHATPEQLKRFFEICGKRKTYKGLHRFSALFSSQLRPLCVEFFTYHALEAIICSNVMEKANLIEYLGVLRLGAINGEIRNLKQKKQKGCD